MSEYASLPNVKIFCIDAILFELSCVECFQYETYHAPLGRPFLVSALALFISIQYIFFLFFSVLNDAVIIEV